MKVDYLIKNKVKKSLFFKKKKKTFEKLKGTRHTYTTQQALSKSKHISI